MKFATHAERMQHPQAKLIPETLWNKGDLFNNELHNELIVLMQAQDSELLELVDKIMPSDTQDKPSVECAWVAIALSHPQLSPEILEKIGARARFHKHVGSHLSQKMGSH